MKKGYVEKRSGGYWVAGTRISLDTIVYAFRRGASPESIKQSFPLLTLEEIYGAITFYLANEEMINKYIAESEIQYAKESEIRGKQFKTRSPKLYNRIKNARVSVK